MLTEKYNSLNKEIFSVLDKYGVVINEDLLPKLEKEKLIILYKTMLHSRIADGKALQYQRQGRMLTFAPNHGEEAAQVGSIAATEERDWLVPAFREMGAWLYKGVSLEQIYLYWYGNEAGSKFPPNVKMLPISVPIASQLNHATGLAMASKIKGEDHVTIAYVGDGGTSQGEFHEALNFASVFSSPVIFVILNNQFAISVGRASQTRSETLAQKGIAYGMPNILVDGNDVLAMYAATKEAVDRARNGGGPTLIEAYTYRIGAHTTSDDPTLYRKDEEVEEWKKKDPIIRMKKYLIEKELWSEGEDLKETESYEAFVNETFKKVEASGIVPLEDIFKYQYEKMTPNLVEQYEEYNEFLKEGGK
ncbi:pyruvate dehydrogenase (acetyl-transferring) E1 component subunit alpha [Clostridium estertheticum]|uniref:pyruvate dehydrogenase (acetyl-transferring) E1 component subunit alpha n=1 Tax=Clostridium estertheticum TaxID=238834 RepID=UPI0013E902B3|nr:pyruvate dehydrogenase (acetyl-transferring) E1 component subunit alpha [Clostridium estertheticum]MBZ9686974.1 pyruvate dehydrogenase (acetyl-transferring) E1 component subunit alpha [Clostridium estertheticum]